MTYPPQQPDPNQSVHPQWPPARQPLSDPTTQQMPPGGYQQPGQPPQWTPTQQIPTGYPPPGLQSPPRVPPAPSPATQTAALQHAIALSSARGWRLEGTSPGVATMVSGHRPNHILHLLLTIFTCGLWAIAWIIIAATVTEKRLTIVADLDGNITYPRGPYAPPPDPTPQVAYSPPQQPKRPAVTTGGWIAIGGGALAAVVLLAVAASGAISSSTQLPDQSRNNNRLYDPPTPTDASSTPATSATSATPTTSVTPDQPAPPANTALSDDDVRKAALAYKACPGKQGDTLQSILAAVFTVAHDDVKGSRVIKRTNNQASIGVAYVEGGKDKETVFNYDLTTHQVTAGDSLASNALETLKTECG
jgi:hypothetical protein